MKDQMLKSRITLDQFHNAFNWKVEKQPLYNGAGRQVPGAFETVRVNPDGGRLHLGTVGRVYRPIQCADIMAAADDLLGTGAGAPWDYSLKNGGAAFNFRLLFPSYLAPESNPGDYLQLCLSIMGSHDGTGAVYASIQAIRAACENGVITLGATYAVSSVRHTMSGAVNGLTGLRRVLLQANEEFDALGVQVNKLSSSRLQNHHVLRAYVLDVLGADPAADLDKLPARTRNVVESMEGLAASGRGNEGRTFWDAYNGVTEYIDHYTKTRGASMAVNPEGVNWSQNAGTGAGVKRRALELALVYAAK